MNLLAKVFIIISFATTTAACKSNNHTGYNDDNKILSAADSPHLKDTASKSKVISKPDSPYTNNTAANEIAAGPEQEFINFALPKNSREIVLLNACLAHGTSKELKQHSLMMWKDHKSLEAELKGYVAKHPAIIIPKDTSTIITITDKTGADWDKAWIDKIIEEHDELLNKFQSARSNINDPVLVILITNAIPVLRSHLAMAKTLQSHFK